MKVEITGVLICSIEQLFMFNTVSYCYREQRGLYCRKVRLTEQVLKNF